VNEEEKLRVLIPHWIEHNLEHAEEFRRGGPTCTAQHPPNSWLRLKPSSGPMSRCQPPWKRWGEIYPTIIIQNESSSLLGAILRCPYLTFSQRALCQHLGVPSKN
jgi:hypothetical protein